MNLGTILLSAIPTSGIIQGTITDVSTGGPLSGVLITVTGASTWTATTIENGSYKINDVTPGSVTISAAKTGYYSVTGTGIIPLGGTLTFSPSLSTAPPATTTSGIKGKVTDSNSGLPIQGALVTISPAPIGMVSLATNSSGMVAQNNIEPGTYTISIDAANYTGQIYTATIVAGNVTDFGTISLSPRPLSTTITGKVMDLSTGQPIVGADVFIVGTTTTVKTDSSGAYTIANITQLGFVIKASLEGYDTLSYTLNLTACGQYPVNFALTSSQAGRLKITSNSPDKQHYPAYSPVSIALTIQNASAEAATGTVSLLIQNQQGEVVGYSLATYTDANGDMQSLFDFQPGSTVTTTIPWDTGNLPPGTYTAIAKVMTGSGGIAGGSSLAVEGATTFVIDSTEAIASLDVSPAPRFANFGETEQINLVASLANRSNVPTALGISYEWRSPSGITLHNGTSTISLLTEESSKALTLEIFPFTFTESGDHQLFLTIVSGPIPTSVTGGVVSVAPQVRIEPSQSISPGTVVPDGDKRIRMQIRLKGVEQK